MSETDWENYDSGPFCRHYYAAGECPMSCARCGHRCEDHEWSEPTKCDRNCACAEYTEPCHASMGKSEYNGPFCAKPRGHDGAHWRGGRQ